MIVEQAHLPDGKLLRLEQYRYERGFFSATYGRRALAKMGIDCDTMSEPDGNHPLRR
jgi:hypothetical protein